jgi:hypothetical protein
MYNEINVQYFNVIKIFIDKPRVFKKIFNIMQKIPLFFVILFYTNAAFSQSDASAELKDNTVLYETPMLYELMNIAYALGDTSIYMGGRNVYFNNINTRTIYYKAVMEYFQAHKNHAFVRLMNRDLRLHNATYMANLTFATHLVWQNNRIKKASNFPFLLRFMNTFGTRQHLLQDFARQTNFEFFYKKHHDYYTKNLADAQKRLGVDSIKMWLEREFSSHYDAYKIVMSPLVGNFHFTQNFNYKNKKTAVMWVCYADRVAKKYTDSQISGIYTGVVFTEIDHNYVNSVSDKYKKTLNKIMGGKHRAKWLKPDGDTQLYINGYDVFNEYMTHAVYLIYTSGVYSAEDQKVIENNRIYMMEKQRKYAQFEEFYKHLKTLYDNRSASENITTLYPKIIEWVEKENME